MPTYKQTKHRSYCSVPTTQPTASTTFSQRKLTSYFFFNQKPQSPNILSPYRIIQGFHMGSTTLTLTLTAPPYLVGAAISFLVAYSSDRNKERGWHISVPMLIAMIGFIISVATLNVPARYFAAFLYCSGCFAANSMVYSWAASVLNETPEKRACATAIVNLLAQLGNIWSPYFFPASDGPRYVMAMLLMMGFSVLSVVAALSMKVILGRANRRLLEEGERTGRAVNLYTL